MQTLKRKPNPVKFVSFIKKAPAQVPLHPWEWPEHPWFKVHADYAGPFKGKMFLLLVDAHSKWLEVHMVDSSTSAATIEKMKPVICMSWLASTAGNRQWEQF